MLSYIQLQVKEHSSWYIYVRKRTGHRVHLATGSFPVDHQEGSESLLRPKFSHTTSRSARSTPKTTYILLTLGQPTFLKPYTMCIAPARRLTPSLAANNTLAVKAGLIPGSVSSSNKIPLTFAVSPKSVKPTIKKASTGSTSTTKHHITVQHNYHDHAADICHDTRRAPARGGVVTPFPLKLHSMLEAVEQEGLNDIVSWQPHGRCFVVHKPVEFVSILMKHFGISKVSSFQRQLNLYGFQRITKGQDKGGYYHELFLRGKVFLSHNIHRVKVKGTKIRARSNPEQEPNFYQMPWLAPSNEQQENSPAAAVAAAAQEGEQNDLDALIDISPDLWATLPYEEPMDRIPVSTIWDEQNDAPIDPSDADLFLEDMDLPEEDAGMFKNIENDDVFGQLLEKMIA
eukprot:scaffold25655_cov142-Cylindrotheca_fusiformis.AAC.1